MNIGVYSFIGVDIVISVSIIIVIILVIMCGIYNSRCSHLYCEHNASSPETISLVLVGVKYERVCCINVHIHGMKQHSSTCDLTEKEIALILVVPRHP